MQESRPKFRIDLIVSEEFTREGTRRVVLKDPVSEKFFWLAPEEYQFLKLFDGTGTLAQVLARFRNKGRFFSEEEARALLSRAASLGLILGTQFGSARVQAHLRDRAQQAKRSKFLSSIYFLYIPLWNPDRFLERTLWLFRLLVNRWTAGLSALLAPVAVYFVIAGLPRMQREFLFFFNLENLFYLWATIAFSKLVHEFSHAYVAKSFGLYVPRMGVAFLLFFPCLYCDTSDAWQLADKRQRIAISAAGVLAEVAVAIIAAVTWHYSRPGMVNSVAFYLMAVSLISTVLFNGNPLMKFDGYFIVIDYFEIPNLQAKALQYVKYLFMNRVLGIAAVGSVATAQRERVWFTVYGLSSLAYRIFLYTGIVAGVYYRFDKVLGLALALLAFCLFIVRPLVRGIKTLHSKTSEVQLQPKGIVVFLLIVAALVVPLLIPLSGKSVYPCYLASAEVQKLTVPLQTSVATVHVRQGDVVRKGAVLFELDASLLQLALLKAESQREIVQGQVDMLRLDAKQRGKASGKETELYHAQEEVKRVKEELRRAHEGVVAPFDGVITSLDYRMQPGYKPGEGAVVGELQSSINGVIRALVPEKDRHKVAVEQQVVIWFPVRRGTVYERRIDSVKSYSEQDLTDSPFSSRFGGQLATEFKGENLKDSPLEAQYTCSVDFPNQADKLPLGMTGLFVVPSPPQTMFSRFVDSIYRTFNRESLN
jgi:putative peptide zinc metalloprotease protein